MNPFKRIDLSDIGASDLELALLDIKPNGRDEFELWKNDEFWVRVMRNAMDVKGVKIHWLYICALDNRTSVTWSEKQAIKDALIGPENDGIERFPPRSMLIDRANAYHLFVIADSKVRFPYDMPAMPTGVVWWRYCPKLHVHGVLGEGI